ncbi:hypothetical protein FQR65_LT12182 [Abscondita terminalis]|nr:hypothetical protein FQR65_LT12182 [Abscondita terminalis]
MQMQHPDVQKVIVNSSYDLIIAEYLTFIPFALSKRFRCPTIAVTSLEATEMVYEYFGVPTHPVIFPNFFLPFSDTKTFIRRIISVVFEIVFRLHLHWYYFPKQDVVIKNLFGRESTPCLELMDQISLLLENTELVFGKIRPRVPTVIPVGGIHRVPAKPLPQELKRILDSARNGFIYFSLGSNVKIKLLPEKVRQIIIETFSELPYTVLWKYEQTTLDDIPKNVFVSKWFPQTDVLRHGNIKLFVTQGGLQSLEEALLSKVPIVGMPFFADQPKNIKKIVEYGFGLFIDYKTLTKKKFKKALVEVIENPQYRKAIGRWSDLAQDQPMSGLDQAVWWVEYVIRHKGAQHLRKTKVVERWYEKLMLDVIGVILIVLGLVSFLVVLVVRVVFKVFKMCFKVCVEKEKSH